MVNTANVIVAMMSGEVSENTRRYIYYMFLSGNQLYIDKY